MNKDTIHILAIESSCDDTSAAVLANDRVLALVNASQAVHREFGGVVPELASRSHQKSIMPTVQAAIEQSGISLTTLDAIAFTRGPGLLGSLLVGTHFAKSLAWSLGIPLIGVNHMEGHILAHFIRGDASAHQSSPNLTEPPSYPFLNLTVSGGHTQLVWVTSPFSFEVVGETLDDAAGETFDKVAKLLNLPYPGGPEIDRLAKTGNPHAFEFARPQIPDLNFSFSGLKTSIRYTLETLEREDPERLRRELPDICASVQNRIIEILTDKTNLALERYPTGDITLSGGVSANSGLRSAFLNLAAARGIRAHVPPMAYCTDNAAMIGMAGYFRFREGLFDPLHTTVDARMSLQSGSF